MAKVRIDERVRVYEKRWDGTLSLEGRRIEFEQGSDGWYEVGDQEWCLLDGSPVIALPFEVNGKTYYLPVKEIDEQYAQRQEMRPLRGIH